MDAPMMDMPSDNGRYGCYNDAGMPRGNGMDANDGGYAPEAMAGMDANDGSYAPEAMGGCTADHGRVSAEAMAVWDRCIWKLCHQQLWQVWMLQ